MNANRKLLVTLEDGIKRITFNRPERRNSVDFETFELLADALRESADDGSRVIILSGAGDAFCSGADLVAVGVDVASLDITEHLRRHTTPTIRAMRQLPVPVIARVHGPAVGIGFSYALACDLCIASDRSIFGLGFIKIGLMPDGGSTYLLPRLVGYQKAFELMSLGETFDAHEALRLGIVNRVVVPEELDATVEQLARRLAGSAQPALGKLKQALNRGALGGELADALDFEAINQNECFHSADFLEGVTAFIQKRPPAFGKTSKSKQ